MIGRFESFARHAGQQQHTADLLADGGNHFHFTTGVLVRKAVLHVDDADYPVPRNQRGGEEGFEAVLRQFTKGLEARVLIGFAGDGQQAAFAGHPSSKTLGGFHAHLADSGWVRRIGSAEDELVIGEEIHQAGIALGELGDQGNNALKNFGKAHFAHHEAADLLEETQLLFRAIQARFELFGLRHVLIIAAGACTTAPGEFTHCGHWRSRVRGSEK